MSEVSSIYLTPRDVAAALQLSRTTVYRRIADGSIRAAQIGGSLRIPSSELDRLAADGSDPAAAELEHLAPTQIALEVDGEWRAYESGDPVPPDVLARFCRQPRPRKAPVIDEANCPACQLEDRDELNEAIRAGMRSGDLSNDRLAARFSLLPEDIRLHRAAGHVDRQDLELEQQRISDRDFDPRLAVAVPVPFPRTGNAYVALRPCRLQDLAGSFRKLLVGDVLHPDEVENGGRGIDALVAQGDVAKLPAAHGVIGLSGVLLERVAELERDVEQLEGRLERTGDR